MQKKVLEAIITMSDMLLSVLAFILLYETLNMIVKLQNFFTNIGHKTYTINLAPLCRHFISGIIWENFFFTIII